MPGRSTTIERGFAPDEVLNDEYSVLLSENKIEQTNAEQPKRQKLEELLNRLKQEQFEYERFMLEYLVFKTRVKHSTSLYHVLDVRKNASSEEIKLAWKKQVVKWHPDRAKIREKKYCEKVTKYLNAVYEILSDKIKRYEYDIYGREWLQTRGFSFLLEFEDV